MTLASGEVERGRALARTADGLLLQVADPAPGGAGARERRIAAVDARALDLVHGPLLERPRLGPLALEAPGPAAWSALLTPEGPVRPWALLTGAALLDLARGPDGDDLLARATCLHRPAPRGRAGVEGARGAAFLLPLAGPDDPGARAVVAGRAALVRAASPVRPLAGHLRRLLRVTDGRTGAAVLLRLAVPAVLRALLPTLDATGVALVFGAAARARAGPGAPGDATAPAVDWACPLCDEPQDALAAPEAACAWCDATCAPGDARAARGLPEGCAARFVVEALAVAGEPGGHEPDATQGPLVARPGVGPHLRPAGGPGPLLTLRPEQVEALGWDHARRQGLPGLPAEVEEHVAALWPGAARALGADGLAAFAARVAEKARAHRLWDVAGACALADALLWLEDPDADRAAGAWPLREALDDPAAPGEERAARAVAFARAAAEARATGAEGADVSDQGSEVARG